MITDDELLSACRAGGLAGGRAGRRAALMYRQACREWRQRHQAIRRAEAERAVLAVLHDTARLVWADLMHEPPRQGVSWP